jgi:Tol biopolymer transport system component
MHALIRFLAVLASLALPVVSVVAAPLDPWRANVSIKLVSPATDRHTTHTYYLTRPESPDGTKVLFFVSKTAAGEHGDLIVQDRATGRETVIARNIDTEDAHRAACQQWISNGKRVAYHDVKNGRWSVHVVDLDTLKDRKLAEDRQLCFGRAVDDILPIYGCHWNPGTHRGLELLNAATGKITEAVPITDVESHYGDYLKKQFNGRPTSIFFPNISPDGRRVFFKMSAPGPEGEKNNYASKNASDRQGTVVYDLTTRKPVFMREQWGHPAWFPDSRHLIEASGQIFDTEDKGKLVRIPGVPKLPGDHPSVSPDGQLFVKDGPMTEMGGKPGEWCVMAGDIKGNDFVVLKRFQNNHGAKSWRVNHPHPIFSADGRRIYFNVNEGQWTQLFVAEINQPTAVPKSTP